MEEATKILEICSLDGFQSSENEVQLNEIRSEVNTLIHSLNNDHQYAKDHGDQCLEYMLSTEICELIKHYFVYLRNLSIEKINAHAKFESGRLSENKYNQYLKEQNEEYRRTARDFYGEIEATLSLLSEPGKVKEVRRNIALVKNPYEIYKAQFQTLKLQIQKILNYDLQLKNLLLRFNYLRNNIHKEIDKELSKARELENSFEMLFALMESENSRIEEIEEKLTKIERTVEMVRLDVKFEDTLVRVVNELSPIQIIRSYDMGMLYLSEINTSSQLKRWMNYSIMPKLRDIYNRFRSQSENSTRFIHSILAAQDTEGSPAPITLDNTIEFQKRNKEYAQLRVTTINDLVNLKEQISNYLTLEAMINNEGWSESAFLNTYTQVMTNTGSVFSKFRIFIDRIAQKIHHFIHRYDYNKPGINAQIVEYLKQRTPEVKGNLYQKVFFDAGRFKDHYLVPRTTEFEKTADAISAWEKGFGNSLLVYGKIQSGKTTYIQSVISADVFENYIIIEPNSALTIEGRKFEILQDLDSTLNEIKKHLSVNKKYCIIIDDLESWSNPQFNIRSIAQAIIRQIDRAPTNVFFLVSANLRFVQRLDTVLDFRSVFTWELELSRMQISEFVQTVLNRHDTAQNVLLEKDKDGLTRSDLAKIAKKVFAVNGEIVGCALHHWTGIIEKPLDQIKSVKSMMLPAIVTPENIQLLDLIMIHKSIAQADLINMIPKNERENMRNQIGRLVKLNIILRDQNGHLSITPLAIYAVNELVSPLTRQEEQEMLNHFLLKSSTPLKEEYTLIRDKILQSLICFPFRSKDSKIGVHRLKDEIHISVEAMETPTQVIKFLDAYMENIQFEFKRKLA